MARKLPAYHREKIAAGQARAWKRVRLSIMGSDRISDKEKEAFEVINRPGARRRLQQAQREARAANESKRPAVREMNERRGVVIHCVSIGGGSTLLRQLAAQNDGEYVTR